MKSDAESAHSPAPEKAVVLENSEQAPRRSESEHHTPAARAPRVGRFVFIALLLAGGAFAFGLVPRLKQRAETRTDTRELALPTVATVAPTSAKAGPPLVLSGE